MEIKKLPNREQVRGGEMQVQEKTVQSLEQLKKENDELKRQLEERQGFFDIRCGGCGNLVRFWVLTEREKKISAVKILEEKNKKLQTIFPVKSKCFIS